MILESATTTFYVTGGTLPAEAASYKEGITL